MPMPFNLAAIKRGAMFLTAVGLLLAGYVLSYAPVLAVCLEFGFVRQDLFGYVAEGEAIVVYRPVDMLIDETFLREPLLQWSSVLNLRSTFEQASRDRRPVPFDKWVEPCTRRSRDDDHLRRHAELLEQTRHDAPR